MGNHEGETDHPVSDDPLLRRQRKPVGTAEEKYVRLHPHH